MGIRREPRRLPGIGRRLFGILLSLALLGVALDFGLRFWAQSWLEGRVREALATTASPDIQLEGFPFLVQFARGRFERVEASAGPVDARGLLVRSIRLDMRDVSFSRGSLITRGGGRIRVDHGSGQIEIEEDALTAYLQDRGFPVTVELVGPDIRVSSDFDVAGASLTASATGPLELDGQRLRFSPNEIDVAGGDVAIPPGRLAFDLPSPRLLRGVRYDRVEVEEGVARLLVTLRDAVIEVPASG